VKITKSQLKQIIKEEISAVMEDRQAHIDGITKKIARLKQAITNAEAGMKNLDDGAVDDMDRSDVRTSKAYTAKQEEVMNLRDKLDVLEDQLQQLQQDSPGQLTRGLEENLQEAYNAERLAGVMAKPMKDPGSYYYNLKSSSEDASSYFGGEDNRPEEVKVINQIANRMYNLDLMIGQAKKLPAKIQQVQQSIQQAASMEGAAAEEAKKAEQALQSLLQGMQALQSLLQGMPKL